MKNSMQLLKQAIPFLLALFIALPPGGNHARAALTLLSDSPGGVYVPANVMLDLSVEWPDAVDAAYQDAKGPLDYIDSSGAAQVKQCPGRDESNDPVFITMCYFEEVTYYGYFDPYKCYDYDSTINSSTGDGTKGAFIPKAATNALHQCNAKWSGNYLNWTTMQTIDGFRWALSGGHRSVDTGNVTILEKARNTGQGGFYDGFPTKRIGGSTFSKDGISVIPVHPKTVTPYFQSASGKPALYVKLEQWYFTPFADPPSSPPGSGGFLMQISSNMYFPKPATAPDFTDTYYVRVRVCDPSAPSAYGATSGLEANCTQYGSTYKPTGVMQANSLTMRFGVFSYLLDSDSKRAGGILRARMKDVGPQKYVPGSSLVVNPKTEWSAANGIFTNNPEPTDASGSGVPNSGVINYLNKFGREGNATYKQFDPVAELYYESLRYLRNESPTSSYISGITTAMKDNFPVITANWDDPLQYSCQKNIVVFLGDSNTNCDSLIPGNTLTNTCDGHSGSLSGDPAINIRVLDNKLGALEGMGSLGNVNYPINDPPYWTLPPDYPPFRKATYHLSGLAYWANISDIRPDDPGKPQTKGKQTVQSFFIDVNQPLGPTGRNIYWLGGKYGGFDDINNDGKPANQQTWDKDGDGIPDNYFSGGDPDKLSKALRKIFNNIAGLVTADASAGLINLNFDTSSSTGNDIYQTFFKTGEWSGDVQGGRLTITAGPPTTATRTTSWSAQALLDSLTAGSGWDAQRKIATRNGSTGVPFRIASLSAAQRNFLGSTAVKQQTMLNYLRGNQSMESSEFRLRNHILGDIVHSKAVPVDVPNASYQDYANPGYSAFKASYASRKKMVYAGANDGMLHAFNGETDLTKDANGGKEVWAYIPSFVLSGPSGTPSVDGLAAYASPANPFQHHYYVDQTPEVRDVNFGNTNGASGGPDWHTILVGGLGKGGKGFYALDVTNGATASNESAAASKVLWEFTDADMGFSFGRPVIIKTAKYGWVVLLTSGYNNVSGGKPGHGFLFIINAKTGALIKKIDTGVGSATTPSGLTRGTAYVQNFDDMTADQFYAGDLLGNMWRFDLREPNGNYAAPVKIAVLTDPSGNPQPITVAPKIEIAKGNNRFVFIGTGRDLTASDATNSQQQSMYGIRDGSTAEPSITTSLIRSNFTKVTNLITGIALPDKGWLYDLTGGSSSTGREQISVDIEANQGIVNFNGNIIANDPCIPSGTGRSYFVQFDTGKSVIADATGSPMSYVTGIGVVGASIVSVNHKLSAVIFDSAGKPTIPPKVNAPYTGNSSIVNWREILE